MKVSVKLNRGGTVTFVPPSHPFRSSDQIRLVFASRFHRARRGHEQGNFRKACPRLSGGRCPREGDSVEQLRGPGIGMAPLRQSTGTGEAVCRPLAETLPEVSPSPWEGRRLLSNSRRSWTS